jgi:hypothetical protein
MRASAPRTRKESSADHRNRGAVVAVNKEITIGEGVTVKSCQRNLASGQPGHQETG